MILCHQLLKMTGYIIIYNNIIIYDRRVYKLCENDIKSPFSVYKYR